MTDKLFNKLWKDALEQPSKEMYIGSRTYSGGVRHKVLYPDSHRRGLVLRKEQMQGLRQANVLPHPWDTEIIVEVDE